MNPKELRYTREHEWITPSGEVRTVGITLHAQKELGDIVYVELPRVGQALQATRPFGTVESVKAVSDLFAPASGAVVEVNADLGEHPERINADPYGGGWLVRIRLADPKEIDTLLSAGEYEKYLGES